MKLLRILGLVTAAGLPAAMIAATAVPHRVAPKAAADHPRFVTRCHVLPDGGFLAYYVRPGTGPALVLIPETHGDRTQFYEPAFLQPLDPQWPIVVIESRGQGRSWPPPTAAAASIEGYANDVLAVVASLGFSRWYVGGHSLGGMIALEVASRAAPGLHGVIALEGWAHARVQRLAFPDTAPRSEAERAEARRQREERYRTQRWNADEVAALGRMWTSWTRGESILAALTLPVLSVWGDRGLEPRPHRASLLLPDKANIQLHWVAGADHYVTDAPFAGEVGVAVARFIGDQEAANPPRP